MESRSDLTPSEYVEARKTLLKDILKDKDLLKELTILYVNHMKTENAIREFVTSVFSKQVRE